MSSLLEKGQAAHKAKDFATAAKLYAQYLQAHPRDAYANYLYGSAMVQTDQPGRAVIYLKKAVAGQPDFIPAISNLGVAYKNVGRVQQAIETYERCISLCECLPVLNDDDRHCFADAVGNLGGIYHMLGENEKAQPFLDRAIELEPEHAIAHWNRGLVRLQQRQWKDGWADYDYGYRANERKVLGHVNHTREWLGEPLAGKTIVVWGEQGIGDEIIFASCIPGMAETAGRVVFDCHPRLQPIFQRSFPDVECIGRRKQVDSKWAVAAGIDFQCPIGSLPRFFLAEDKCFPIGKYLVPDWGRVNWWRAQHPKGFRIGLSWRGGKGEYGNPERSMELEKFAAFVRPIQGVEWISLQYGNHYPEIELFNQKHGTNIWTHESAMEDYNETVNLTATCDLVITVVTAIVHTAGALGVPTLCLTPKGAAWKFTKDRVLPWHATVRQFHQQKKYDWNDVLEGIGNALNRVLKDQGIAVLQ